ncbi:PREDICTED: uncharacterized protein LOC109359872 [Lupinus angustifolius]|uniref:uncharacterized protein LOC109359872 n=1 Tax=Lupinus angustifolius TaxID=3871 RepID=UPI00092FC8FE|nr:PREDICTED: uncharacterized protein LOC109359872 [Lupinus angustifolius]
MSRLDRFLISTSWASKWPSLVHKGLERQVSDHCPVVRYDNYQDWGPKPFRVIDAWFEDKDFICFVEQNWNKLSFSGWRIHDIDLKRETMDLSDEDARNTSDLLADIWRARSLHQNLIFQKSRSKWLKEGDTNSKFFHGLMNSRKRHNSIHGVSIHRNWIEDVHDIRQGIRNHFATLFNEHNRNRSTLSNISFSQLDPTNNAFLTSKFDEEDIKNAIWDCVGSKSPGPDGFNFKFIKAF